MWHFTQPSSVESPALNCTQFSPDFSYPATHKQSVAESEPLLDSACGVHEAQVEVCVAAVTVLYVMLGHKLQSSDPIVFLYFPAEQSTHVSRRFRESIGFVTEDIARPPWRGVLSLKYEEC